MTGTPVLANRHAASRRHQEARECLERLSAREREVARLLALGLANKEVARELGISENTVHVHRQHVMEKTGTGSAAELARLDKSMQPLLTHVTDHYVRVYLGVGKGAKAADRCLQDLGYVEHCFRCGSFDLLHELKTLGVCRRCSSKTALAGPLWLGRIQNAGAIAKALDMAELSRRRCGRS